MGIRFGIGLPGPFYYSTSVGGRRRRDDRPLGPEEQKAANWILGFLFSWMVINWIPTVTWAESLVATLVIFIVVGIVKSRRKQ